MNAAEERQRQNRSLTAKLWLFVAGSFAFGFALVPLYRVLCQITGYGDQKTLSEAAQSAPTLAVAGREVTVEFMANLPTVGNWEFRPSQLSLRVHPGRVYEATFVARNLTGHDTVAQAVPNIAPGEAAAWFHKTSASASHRNPSAWVRNECCRCTSSSIASCRSTSIGSPSVTPFTTPRHESPRAKRARHT